MGDDNPRVTKVSGNNFLIISLRKIPFYSNVSIMGLFDFKPDKQRLSFIHFYFLKLITVAED
jgi:hypothetical protein